MHQQLRCISLGELQAQRAQAGLIYFKSPTCPHCIQLEPKMQGFNQALATAKLAGSVPTKVKMVAFDVTMDPEQTLTQDIQTVPQLMFSSGRPDMPSVPMNTSVSAREFLNAVEAEEPLIPNTSNILGISQFIDATIDKAKTTGLQNPLGLVSF
jgi:hypothetical protein